MRSGFERIHFLEKRKTEREIKEQIRKDAEIPDEVYESAQDAYQMILDGAVRQEQEEKRRHVFMPASVVPRLACGMAAMLVVCVVVSTAFPAQVRALPIVGSIFAQIQDELGYENLSEYAQKLEEDADMNSDSDVQDNANVDAETASNAKENGRSNLDAIENENADAKENGDMNSFTKKNGGLTVSCSEVYADPETLYLSMKLKSDEPFPKSFYYMDEKETEKIEGKIPMLLHGSYSYSFMEKVDSEEEYSYKGENLVEGLMVNENTFELLWRIGLSGDWARYLIHSNTDKEIEMPEKFTLNLDIDQIYAMFSQEKTYMGPWNFSIPVTIDDSHIETVEIHEDSETGAGLLSVEKTPFEITTHALTPGLVGYKVVVLDANGNKLPIVDSESLSYSEVPETMDDKWKIQGYDVSSIEVFVLGNAFYENIYSKGIWGDLDWEGNETKAEEEKLGTLLRQYAEYNRVISFE